MTGCVASTSAAKATASAIEISSPSKVRWWAPATASVAKMWASFQSWYQTARAMLRNVMALGAQLMFRSSSLISE
eukprot:672681-Pyramimonas_sp.AAC.1